MVFDSFWALDMAPIWAVPGLLIFGIVIFVITSSLSRSGLIPLWSILCPTHAASFWKNSHFLGVISILLLLVSSVFLLLPFRVLLYFLRLQWLCCLNTRDVWIPDLPFFTVITAGLTKQSSDISVALFRKPFFIVVTAGLRNSLRLFQLLFLNNRSLSIF